ncbi:MAG TPA: phospholipase A [Gallionella sp.]|nr:phospholipase A [Gallionella sp.]
MSLRLCYAATGRYLTAACVLLLCAMVNAHAAEADFLQCASKPNDDERLKCYDDLAWRQTNAPAAVKPEPVALPEIPSPLPAQPEVKSVDWNSRSYLTRAWNLDGRAREGGAQLTPLRPYRTSYLIVRSTNSPNRQPNTPAAGHTTAVPLDLDTVESKFLISFKAEIMNYREIHWLNFRDFRLWGAYTQQSNWQAFNARSSAPFRETNYEPELIATFGTANPQGLKMVNVGFVHQSNGKQIPESRSWNRVYLQGGWEWDNNLSLLARGWWRIPETAMMNDNPDLQSYLGYGDALIRWEPDTSQSVSLLLRNNLQTGQNRGFAQLDWTTPVFIGKSAKLHAQVSNGYGESLIDYNHPQTTFGLGISFREW